MLRTAKSAIGAAVGEGSSSLFDPFAVGREGICGGLGALVDEAGDAVDGAEGVLEVAVAESFVWGRGH